MLEPIPGHSKYLDPPDPRECPVCDEAGCDGQGFIPGGTKANDEIVCSCTTCHSDPAQRAQVEAERKYDQQREDGK